MINNNEINIRWRASARARDRKFRVGPRATVVYDYSTEGWWWTDQWVSHATKTRHVL